MLELTGPGGPAAGNSPFVASFLGGTMADAAAATGGVATAPLECFGAALQDVLAEAGTVSADELSARARGLAARAPGHDHDHRPGPLPGGTA